MDYDQLAQELGDMRGIHPTIDRVVLEAIEKMNELLSDEPGFDSERFLERSGGNLVQRV